MKRSTDIHSTVSMGIQHPNAHTTKCYDITRDHNNNEVMRFI